MNKEFKLQTIEDVDPLQELKSITAKMNKIDIEIKRYVKERDQMLLKEDFDDACFLDFDLLRLLISRLRDEFDDLEKSYIMVAKDLGVYYG